MLSPPDSLAEVDENGRLLIGTEEEMRERWLREEAEHQEVMRAVRKFLTGEGEDEDLDDGPVPDLDDYDDL